MPPNYPKKTQEVNIPLSSNTWKSSRVPNGFWNIKQNRLDYLNWLGAQLDFKKMDDWYGITKKQISEKGGGGLLSHFKDSPSKLVRSVYSEHPWVDEKFKRIQLGLRVKNDLERIGKQLGVNQMDDWYGVTVRDIHVMGGSGIINMFGNSPSLLIQSVYPQHPWNLEKFRRHKLKKKELDLNLEKKLTQIERIELTDISAPHPRRGIMF